MTEYLNTNIESGNSTNISAQMDSNDAINVAPTMKSELDDSVYAIIGGVPVAVPAEATHVLQDSRGNWYWATRKPRLAKGDWSPYKSPIQIASPDGTLLPRILQTPINGDWKKSLQSTIKKSELPQEAIHIQ